MEKSLFLCGLMDFMDEESARALANNYTDEEINNYGKEIIDEIKDEYRFCANVDHYRDCGY